MKLALLHRWTAIASQTYSSLHHWILKKNRLAGVATRCHSCRWWESKGPSHLWAICPYKGQGVASRVSTDASYRTTTSPASPHSSRSTCLHPAVAIWLPCPSHKAPPWANARLAGRTIVSDPLSKTGWWRSAHENHETWSSSPDWIPQFSSIKHPQPLIPQRSRGHIQSSSLKRDLSTKCHIHCWSTTVLPKVMLITLIKFNQNVHQRHHQVTSPQRWISFGCSGDTLGAVSWTCRSKPLLSDPRFPTALFTFPFSFRFEVFSFAISLTAVCRGVIPFVLLH